MLDEKQKLTGVERTPIRKQLKGYYKKHDINFLLLSRPQNSVIKHTLHTHCTNTLYKVGTDAFLQRAVRRKSANHNHGLECRSKGRRETINWADP